jgi:hypothetical protein
MEAMEGMVNPSQILLAAAEVELAVLFGFTPQEISY